MNDVLGSQKQSTNKSGVGHEEGQWSKSTKGEQKKIDANNTRYTSSKIKNSTLKRSPILRKAHMTKLNNSYFYGYFFTYNYFRHKAINCRVFSRRDFSFVNRNSFAPLRNYNVICYNCNKFGHTTRVCKSGMTNFTKNVGSKDKVEESTKVWRKNEKQILVESLIVQTNLLAQNEKDFWYVHSGCSRHMTEDESNFLTHKKSNGGKVRFGCNSSIKVVGKGTLMLNDGKTKVENVLFVEGLKHNLLSVSQLCDQRHCLAFSLDYCKISKDGIHIVEASREANNLYILDDVKSEICCLS